MSALLSPPSRRRGLSLRSLARLRRLAPLALLVLLALVPLPQVARRPEPAAREWQASSAPR